ncbi:MAG: aldehyde dehydrogenase family protein, partial [Gammaproteobacteria bacterium]
VPRRPSAGARGQRSDAEEPPLAIRAELPGSASVVRFSPDGTRYAVALAPTPLIDDFYVNRKITIVETETSRVIGRVEHEGKLGEFVWSPDGTRIAFIGAADPNDPLEGRLYVVSADGGEPRRVDRDYPGHIERLMWLDAETLLYVGARGVFTEIARTRVDEPFEIPPEPEGGPIVRTLHGSAAGRRFALVAETPQHPQEVYVWSEAEGYRRLTRSNPILDERDLAPQEVLRYTARDGLVIEGILVGPMQRQPGRRYPVVIAVHGGPESHFSHGWMSSYTFPAQAMAADGFAFFYPNYRASTGRGVEFSKLDHRDPAGREFDDLVDAINSSGFGLTLGVHSRLESVAKSVARRARVGNVYVNRNIIGAQVGVQPFGGVGLSGTGPKAGGPHYLLQFATEQTYTVNTMAIGGNASLLAMD